MKPFMTLEEFLAMSTGMVVIHESASFWLDLYRTAKASYEQYGDEGPPVGSKVETLVPGYGGGAGVRRTFNGVLDANPMYFSLTSSYGNEYLCKRVIWWREIKVVSEPKEAS